VSVFKITANLLIPAIVADIFRWGIYTKFGVAGKGGNWVLGERLGGGRFSFWLFI
jgi:hypothetical protein